MVPVNDTKILRKVAKDVATIDSTVLCSLFCIEWRIIIIHVDAVRALSMVTQLSLLHFL
jgi:hypothetical protein